MNSFAGFVAVGLLFPPVLIAVVAGWILSRKKRANIGKDRRFVRKGAWISVVVALAYYGFLSMLAGINAANSGGLGGVLYVGVPILITLLLTAICFGIYLVSFWVFGRQQGGEA